MNKCFSSAFIIIYLGSFFFCIFLRIESWPFSDYRMYAGHTHPQFVRTYAPYFELSDGSYIPPIIKKKQILHVSKFRFKKAYDSYSSSDYDKYINTLLKSKEMKLALERMKKQNLFPVKFIVMKVTFTEQKKHKWTPVYTPVKKYDIL